MRSTARFGLFFGRFQIDTRFVMPLRHSSSSFNANRTLFASPSLVSDLWVVLCFGDNESDFGRSKQVILAFDLSRGAVVLCSKIWLHCPSANVEHIRHTHKIFCVLKIFLISLPPLSTVKYRHFISSHFT